MEMLRLWRQIRRDRSPEGDGNSYLPIDFKKFPKFRRDRSPEGDGNSISLLSSAYASLLEEIDPLKGTEIVKLIVYLFYLPYLEEIDPLKGTEIFYQFIHFTSHFY